MEHHTTASRTEAERLLGVAEKLLRNKDLSGSRDFAILAQETEPLLDGSDQILAVAEVLLASENKKLANNQPDWYSILQIPQCTDDTDLIKKQYRRLALLLHPDKNNFPFADSAFRLVADAWKVLSDPLKKSSYDNEFASRYVKVDLVPVNNSNKRQQRNQNNSNSARNEGDSNQKLPVRRSGRNTGASISASNVNSSGVNANASNKKTDAGVRVSNGGGGVTVNNMNDDDNNAADTVGNFWTACPYCYNLFEYPRMYLGCCLRCDNVNCKRAFTASQIISMPPLVPGRDAYYCCWGFFPMGFVSESGDKNGGGNSNGLFGAKWMPPMFGDANLAENRAHLAPGSGAPATAPKETAPPRNVGPATGGSGAGLSSSGKKRGRPRKNI